MKFEDQRILVTGAGGFIGSHLVERLLKLSCKVSCFVRYNSFNRWGFLDTLTKEEKDRLEVFSADLKDSDAIRKAVKDKDLVFHLGAAIAIPHSYEYPREFLQSNIEGTFNVLQACLDYDVKKVVHTSTSEVYGSALKVPISEDHPLQAQSPYSASKIAADKLAESFHLSYGLKLATIRPFNTFGPRQSARAIIPTIITQALEKSEVVIGNGKPTRDFNYVDNTVDGFLKVAETEKAVGKTVNVGSGTEISIDDLAKKIAECVGKDVKIIRDEKRFRPNKSEVMRLCCDNSKAKELGWTPKINLDDGLAKTIKWVKQNLDLYKTDLYNI